MATLPELVPKRRRQRLEGVDDQVLDVVVARIPGKHPQTIAGVGDLPLRGRPTGAMRCLDVATNASRGVPSDEGRR